MFHRRAATATTLVPSIASRLIQTRAIHNTSRLYRAYFDVIVTRKEAEAAIPFPASVRMQIHRIPNRALPQQSPHGRFSYRELVDHHQGLRKFRESSVYFAQMQQCTAVVEVRGPLGVGYVPVPEWLDFTVSTGESDTTPVDIWHGQGATGGSTDNDTRTVYSTDTVPPAQPDADRYLRVACVDPEAPFRERHWGFYKRRIATYVKSVTEGVAVAVRLNGVGFRAQLEPLKIQGPEKHDALMFETWLNRWKHLIHKDPMRLHLAQQFPDSLWAQMLQLRQHLNHDVNMYFRTIEPAQDKASTNAATTTGKPPAIPSKLLLKLGRSHNEEVLVPPFIDATVPNPSRMVLAGVHVQQIMELAADLRRLRPPEPYKGKGVFVREETIQLKQKKVK